MTVASAAVFSPKFFKSVRPFILLSKTTALWSTKASKDCLSLILKSLPNSLLLVSANVCLRSKSNACISSFVGSAIKSPFCHAKYS